MSERRGTKALEVWCKRVTEGYPGVKIENMTTSWRDGLAFCAMIHHFRPDLIDFNSLDKRDVFRNNELAFRIAERHLGIPALLDAEDMVEYEVPDRLSMLTYLSQFYQTFVGQQGHCPNSRTPLKRSSVSPSLSSSPEMSPNMSPNLSPTSSSPPSKVPARGTVGGSRPRLQRDPCTHCGLPVFLAERLLVGNKRALYHRTCFRCARCSNQLTLADCYETEDGLFCCETCPDEEHDKSDTCSLGKDIADSSDSKSESVLSMQGSERMKRNLSLSDDEKSIEAKSGAVSETPSVADEYSANFESALEEISPSSPSKEKNSTVKPFAPEQHPTHDLSSKSNDTIQKSMLNFVNKEMNWDTSTASNLATNWDTTRQQEDLSVQQCKPESSTSHTIDQTQNESEEIASGSKPSRKESDALKPPSYMESSVNSCRVSSSSYYQPVTASFDPSEAVNCTKDSQYSSADDTGLSIVKMRMKLFEGEHSTNTSENLKGSKKSSTTLVKSNVSLISNHDIQDKNSGLETKNVDSKVEMEYKADLSKEADVKVPIIDKSEENTDEARESGITKDRTKECSESTINEENSKAGRTDEMSNQATEDTSQSVSADGNEEHVKVGFSVEDPEACKYQEACDNFTNNSCSNQGKTVENGDSRCSKIADKDFDDERFNNETDPITNDLESSVNAPHYSSALKPSVSPRKMIPVPSTKSSSAVRSSEKTIYNDTPIITYPSELNPFGEDIEDNDAFEEKKETGEKDILNMGRKVSTNPFGSSDEEDEGEDTVVLRKDSPHKPPRPPPPRVSTIGVTTSAVIAPSVRDRPKTISALPEASLSSPVPAQRRIIPAPANLNPFWSDGEEPDDSSTPVPRPRTIKPTPEPSPRPCKSSTMASKMVSSSGLFGSSSSLTSMTSTMSTNRRSKKPAPLPPTQALGGYSAHNVSTPSSPSLSVRRSPRPRKARPAPRPPAPTAASSAIPVEGRQSVSPLPSLDSSWTNNEGDVIWDGQKTLKDEANRSKKAAVDQPIKEDSTLPRDKSTYGQWKRKKGPAPPRPAPQRRKIRAMPLKEVKRELDDIEVKQLELERQGVQLEQTIRRKFDEAPGAIESSMTPDVEDLVLQLFELVNEKNELFRRQAELMYLRRQQRLEEEHADLEYQIRCLMEQPERNKTDSDKAREEDLIQRLVEVVERRNEIVECLEMDRLREAEEDHSIHTQLGLFAAKNMTQGDVNESLSPSKTKKEKKKKEKETKKSKKGIKVDADKDIDEVEAAAAKEKKTKKKWF